MLNFKTKPSTGGLLQRNCWSHSCRPPWLDQQLGTIHPTSQLLARHFNIPEVNNENNSWHHHQQPSDNADRHEESQESTPKSKMEDDVSIAANVGTASAPSQIHQLATVLWNILNNDSTPMLRSSRSLRIQEMT